MRVVRNKANVRPRNGCNCFTRKELHLPLAMCETKPNPLVWALPVRPSARERKKYPQGESNPCLQDENLIS